MRQFKKGLATFVVATAVLVPAGLAGASAQSASTPVKAPLSSGSCTALVGCGFTISVNGVSIASGNNINAQLVSNICGNDVLAVALLNVGDFTNCQNDAAAIITRIW